MATLKKHLADAVTYMLNGFARLLGKRFYNIYLDNIARKYNKIDEPVSINIDGKQVLFACPNRMVRWRLETYFTKEPATLAWIDEFKSGAIMWDIGANLGLYSIYAALKRQANVIAFEPIPANYSLICENIELNKLNAQLSVFPIAISDRSELGVLNMSNSQAGSAFSNFTSATAQDAVPHRLIGYSIDGFIEAFQPPFPQHIKIDVDGIEDKILLGAAKTLRDPRLHSVCIEGDENQMEQLTLIKTVLQDSGFILKHSFRSPIAAESPFINLFFARAS